MLSLLRRLEKPGGGLDVAIGCCVPCPVRVGQRREGSRRSEPVLDAGQEARGHAHVAEQPRQANVPMRVLGDPQLERQLRALGYVE